jgi:hypothetical protein
MSTFIVVLAIAAFIPYVAAPGIANGVKAISTPSPEVSLDDAPQAPAIGGDMADRLLPRLRESRSAG